MLGTILVLVACAHLVVSLFFLESSAKLKAISPHARCYFGKVHAKCALRRAKTRRNSQRHNVRDPLGISMFYRRFIDFRSRSAIFFEGGGLRDSLTYPPVLHVGDSNYYIYIYVYIYIYI